MREILNTFHRFIFKDARKMADIESDSIDLVVTSPPYPMISMWDDLFSTFNEDFNIAIEMKDGRRAFEIAHTELDKVWRELERVVKPSGFVCINIGDATRTINDKFCLFPNHSRIISAMQSFSFDCLPLILWKKTTNAPNKFMGSGMLPAGAYVTLEHEYILVFRKGGKRKFKSIHDKQQRSESAFFWEERNSWFSNVWDLKGVSQNIENKKTRSRSAAYLFELPFRLINMFSVRNDIVLDPFLGTGTTSSAALYSGRNSIGYEIDAGLKEIIYDSFYGMEEKSESLNYDRISKHVDFVLKYENQGKKLKYVNVNYGFKVMTNQETKLEFQKVDSVNINMNNNEISVKYSPYKFGEKIKLKTLVDYGVKNNSQIPLL